MVDLFKTLIVGLAYDLKVEKKRKIYPRGTEIVSLTPKDLYYIEFPATHAIKPVLFPMDLLDKVIMVKTYNSGKPFIPMDELRKEYGVSKEEIFYSDAYKTIIYQGRNDTRINLLYYSEINDLLDKWHFNRRNLKESEYINAQENKCYG